MGRHARAGRRRVVALRRLHAECLEFPTLFVQNPNLALTFLGRLEGSVSSLMSSRLARVVASAAAVATLAVPVAASAGSPAQVTALEQGSAPSGAWAVAGYPQQNVLPVWPDNPNDASIAIGVTPYDEIAPKLNALQAQSNRVSARVAGKSSGGYDLYEVIVTVARDRRRGRAADGLEAAARRQPGRRPRRTRRCWRATRRRCSSTATSTATSGRAPTPSCASSTSGPRAPTRPSRRCSSATASSSTSPPTRTAASPVSAPTPRAMTSTATW